MEAALSGIRPSRGRAGSRRHASTIHAMQVRDSCADALVRREANPEVKYNKQTKN
jgi:hypothetical protein